LSNIEQLLKLNPKNKYVISFKPRKLKPPDPRKCTTHSSP